MIDTLPAGKGADGVFIYAIYVDGAHCGCAYVARHYPAHGSAQLVLPVRMEVRRKLLQCPRHAKEAPNA